jgi:mono/diheme cytochrome c family protein
MGDGNLFPPLAGSEWVNGDKKKLVNILLQGLNGTITVAGRKYNNAMPKFDFLSDQQIADLLSYVRYNFGNGADSVKAADVKRLRLSH